MIHAKTVCTSVIIAAGLSAAARERISLNLGWEFMDGPTEWRTVDLPHDYQIEQPWVAPEADERPDDTDGAANIKSRLSARGFKEMGVGVYRRPIFIDDSLKGKRVLLDFGGIMLTGDVYINDINNPEGKTNYGNWGWKHIGETDYGYLGFECDITDKVRYGTENYIMVVSDTGGPLHSRWYTGGGLYRGVDMVITSSDLFFNRHPLWIQTPEISEKEAVVKITADINAPASEMFLAVTRIISPTGETVASVTDTITVNHKWRNREYDLTPLRIAAPSLWSCETPALYTAVTELRRMDGSVADKVADEFGIRTIEYSPEFGFKLNGKKVLVKGISGHSTLGALGAAAYPRAIEKTIQLLKSFGFNEVRTAHNPYSEEFLDICDRNGILVVNELYDKWLKQYAGGRKEWTEQWQNDLPEWLKRDRNHPSVIMWSLGNELQGYNNLPFNDWGVTAYRLQKTLLDKYDTTRPVTVAMHPRVRSLETDSLPAPLVHECDIASYNFRYMYFPGDARRFPNLIFFQSEANLSMMGPNFFVPDNDKVVGLSYWGMIDYLGESLGWPAKGWTDGVFDISLNPKPNAWFLKSMFMDEPTVRIGIVKSHSRLTDWNGAEIGGDVVTDSWNLAEGDTVKIFTYTNADEVELRLNGKQIGRKRNETENPNKRNRIVWDKIPFKRGKIEAIAYTDGKISARHEIETAGKPVKLIAEADNTNWQGDGIDLQHVAVTATDSKGRRVPYADSEVRFDVEGPARIVAVSNGDMTSEELNVQNHRRLYNGRALVILRSTGEPGEVTLKISCDGYKPVVMNLTTK